ncbi:aspartate:alanine exchanger family transporter [Tessaracoccus sp. OH4464_COT-324]|uniref:aspartate:alanine exchanger family transporter n=1 Tax=Tessaracoccus sp. OH4464_COT-324 TaxID=2491059 RepID=UPI000F62EBA8|nr:TrkA C-terminal domain-containing protein [Tessaracoccus sp. OH4464_COT-324]RRD46375.1 transporter [Tessaracoccus sp. OH4464_COT-324]
MLDLLVENPLLTLFVVIALGTVVGAVPLGPLRFGASGALFVGLLLGALDPRLGEGLAVVQSIGLGLFVYTIGLAAGSSFFRDFRRQALLMLGAVALLGGYAMLVVGAGKLVGMSAGLAGGLFAGTLSATPAVAAAQQALNDPIEPAVGFAITYPLAILLGMVAVSVVTRFRLPARRDPDRAGSARLVTRTVELHQDIAVEDVPGIAEIPSKAGGEVRISYHWRDGHMKVARPDELLRAGDRVLLVGTPDGVAHAASLIGHEVREHLMHDRRAVDFRRYVVSNPRIAGRTVAELAVPDRFDGLITRIRRGDQELLAHAEMKLQLGDRVRVVAPAERLDELTGLFGDSERKVTEVDFWTVGLGIALGVALGMVTITLGFGQIALGSAAGPLIVGLLLGWVDRTGPFVWTMPSAANLTIRQLGLVLFLATMGLASGPAFASRAFSWEGLRLGATAVAVLGLLLVLFWLLGWAVGHSTARVAGAMAGLVGQPAVLNHVNSLIDDDRAESGYTALFAIGFIAKIVLVQLVVSF